MTSMTPEEQEAVQRVQDSLNAFLQQDYRERIAHRLEETYGREPRWRYFHLGQTMFCWTTEPWPDGTYSAFIYKPRGKGARTGKAQVVERVKEVRFRQRKTAKARALKWYQTAKGGAA